MKFQKECETLIAAGRLPEKKRVGWQIHYYCRKPSLESKTTTAYISSGQTCKVFIKMTALN
jgi:hypothetical protein